MRLKYLLLAALIAFLQINLFAEHVSADKARQVGKSFMAQQHSTLTSKGTVLKMYKSLELTENTSKCVDNQHFYVFNLNDNQGWVIVADDDLSIPILGYSKSGEFVTENLPANIADWLHGISSEIQYIIDNDIVIKENITQWDELASGTSTEFISRGDNAISPLIATKWDQAPYYNDLCPYDYYYYDRTVTGCVATAMAQVMKYWNHPAVGSGSHSYSTSSYGTLYANFGGTNYDWNNMPNKISSSSSQTQKTAVATLMYHCGVSVEMEYGVSQNGGSGAFVISSYTNSEHCSEYALKNYFGYKETAHGEMKDDYSDSQWKSMVRAELSASRPLIYAGFGNGGHCFVCEGYDNNDKFYFNWGWSGQNDGYYSLSALNPGSGGAGGGSYSFTSNQQAIFGLEPEEGGQPGPSNATVQLCSNVNIESQISYGGNITATVQIANYSGSNFSGTVGAAAFDNDGNFVSFINTCPMNLNVNETKTFTFSTTNNTMFVAGHYQVEIFYKTSDEDWTILDDGNYTNYASFDIVYSTYLETHSNFTILTDGGRLIQGSVASINVDIKNTGEDIFNGQFKISLSSLEGIWVQDVKIVDVNGFGQGYHYTNGKTFTGRITAEPGSYHMEVAFKPNGSNEWNYVGATDFPNPVTVVVEAPSAVADIYEDNSTQAQAYELQLGTWTNNQTTVTTTGSNIHVGNDLDYYKIELPKGYNYSIKPRLYDAYSSGNGQNYSVDAMFAYSTDGQNYSEPIDDVMSGSIVFNGGTIFFVVSPSFSGMTGTYLLEIKITGDGDIGIDEDYAAQITLYPNPVSDVLHVECEQMIGYDIFSYDGQTVKSMQLSKNEAVIDFNNLDCGIYILRIITKEGSVSQQIIKQ